jgi:phosphate transport system permease protein
MNSETSMNSDYVSDRLKVRPTRHLKEWFIHKVLFAAACVSVATTIGIIYILVAESINFFRVVSFWSFLTDTVWSPLFSEPRYGIAPLLLGTLTTSAVALLVAIPVGSIIAIYLSEFAGPKLRETCKPVLELLGGVPTIVYGHFALVFVTPMLQKIFPSLPGFSMLAAGLVMGIAIIPFVSSLAEDAMRAVPMSLREASYAMGSTRVQTALRVVFPAALSGILSAYILGISRAVGETMIVAVAAGMQPNFTINPLEPAQTISAYIVQVALGDLPHGSVAYQSIFAAGLSLVIMTLLFNILGYSLRKRFRQHY